MLLRFQSFKFSCSSFFTSLVCPLFAVRKHIDGTEQIQEELSFHSAAFQFAVEVKIEVVIEIKVVVEVKVMM